LKSNLNSKSNAGDEVKKAISSPEFFFNDSELTQREHSKSIDQYLGFRILRIERKLIQQYRTFFSDESKATNKKLHSESGETGESWVGLNPQVLLTPYSELYEIFNLLRESNINSIVDIGCAYGRVGIVAKAFFPLSSFTGYEIVKKRVGEAKRISSIYDLELNILNQNVLDEDFELPNSSIYFIYDFSHFMHIKSILLKLEQKIGKHPFILVAKGEDVRSIIQLFFPIFLTKKEPIYKKNWCIFFAN
jgi:SAM-dependent methyltransferase